MLLSFTFLAIFWPPPTSAATAGLLVALERCATTRQERICDSALAEAERLSLPQPERQLLRGVAYFNKFAINEERFLERPISLIPLADYSIERGYYMMQPAERAHLKELGQKSMAALKEAPKGDIAKGIVHALRDTPIEW